MLVHKSCDLKNLDGRDALQKIRRGISFYGSVPVSFEPFGTPSAVGGVTIAIANNYAFDEHGGYIDSIECLDCGGVVAEFPHGIELYKLERQLDTNYAEFDLEEI